MGSALPLRKVCEGGTGVTKPTIYLSRLPAMASVAQPTQVTRIISTTGIACRDVIQMVARPPA
jgi:hypothetical protein